MSSFAYLPASTVGAHGAVAIDGTSLTYIALDPTYTGTDTFTYTVSDERGGTATATVTVELMNMLPEAGDEMIAVHAGTSGSSFPTLGDPDGDTVTITSFTQGAHGSVALDGTAFVYTAASPTYTGTDTFTYTIGDGHGGAATGTITVELMNMLPEASDAWATTLADTPVSIPVAISDPDGDAVTITSFTQPSAGSVSPESGGAGFYYLPPSGFDGTVTFTYTVDDGHGGTATGTVMVTVMPAVV